MERAKTNVGLITTVEILDKKYELKRTVTKEFKKNPSVIIIVKDLPNWNYRAVPNG